LRWTFISIETDGRTGTDSPITIPSIPKEKVIMYGMSEEGQLLNWETEFHLFSISERTTMQISMFSKPKESDLPEDSVFRSSPYYIHEGESKALVKVTSRRPELKLISRQEDPLKNQFVSLLLGAFLFHPL
jgi:hypothetical protein